MDDYELLVGRANKLLADIEDLEIENASAIRSKKMLEDQLVELSKKVKDSREALDIATHAIEILRGVSDEAVTKAYSFLQDSINSVLAKMFTDTTRRIQIKEYTRQNQYPQLELILDVGNGVTRSIKSDSGHGIAQIISFLSVICLIVITGSRRLVIIDEVLSGLSVRNRKIVCEVMWSFTEIGFQFIVNEHGLIVKGAQVYHFKMENNVGRIEKEYIAETGAYLMATDDNDLNNIYSVNEYGADSEEEEKAVGNEMSLNNGVLGAVSNLNNLNDSEGDILGI